MVGFMIGLGRLFLSKKGVEWEEKQSYEANFPKSFLRKSCYDDLMIISLYQY